jgi:hypothetical protein
LLKVFVKNKMFNPFSEMCNHDIILCIATIATYIPLYYLINLIDCDANDSIAMYQSKIDLLVKENEELKEKLKIYEDEESVWEDIDTDDETEYEISRTCYECECVVISEKYIHIFDGKRYCGGCNPEPISTDESTDEGTNESTNKMPVFYELIQNTFNDYIMLLIDVKKVLRLILNIILNQIYSLFEQYIEKHTSYGN